MRVKGILMTVILWPVYSLGVCWVTDIGPHTSVIIVHGLETGLRLLSGESWVLTLDTGLGHDTDITSVSGHWSHVGNTGQ